MIQTAESDPGALARARAPSSAASAAVLMPAPAGRKTHSRTTGRRRTTRPCQSSRGERAPVSPVARSLRERPSPDRLGLFAARVLFSTRLGMPAHLLAFWTRALDSAERAVESATAMGALSDTELRERRHHLVDERRWLRRLGNDGSAETRSSDPLLPRWRAHLSG